MSGDDLLRGRATTKPDLCIFISGCATEAEARRHSPVGLAHLKQNLYPWLEAQANGGKETKHYATWIRKWWQPHNFREEMFEKTSARVRLIACSNPQARPIFTLVSTRFIPNNTLQLFPFDDDYSFVII